VANQKAAAALRHLISIESSAHMAYEVGTKQQPAVSQQKQQFQEGSAAGFDTEVRYDSSWERPSNSVGLLESYQDEKLLTNALRGEVGAAVQQGEAEQQQQMSQVLYGGFAGGREQQQQQQQQQRVIPAQPRQVQHPDGKLEQFYPDGKRITMYTNGTMKTTHPDGSSSIRFRNGDYKHQLQDGRVDYYYAEVATWQSSYRGGLEVFHFPTGQREGHHADGVKEIVFADGTCRRVLPDG
jgi:centromere protein J